MIRPAMVSDIPALIEMGMRFHASTAYAKLLSPDKAVVEETLFGLINIESGAVFVDDRDGVLVGAILGMIVPHFITGENVCGELSWWVDPECRGAGRQLLKALEEWALIKGASAINVTEPPGNPRVGRFYEHAGYQRVEVTYTKAL